MHITFQIFDFLLNGDIYPYPTYFFNVTGSTNYYNILRQEVCLMVVEGLAVRLVNVVNANTLANCDILHMGHSVSNQRGKKHDPSVKLGED
jgi:hypothetical protein